MRLIKQTLAIGLSLLMSQPTFALGCPITHTIAINEGENNIKILGVSTDIPDNSNPLNIDLTLKDDKGNLLSDQGSALIKSVPDHCTTAAVNAAITFHILYKPTHANCELVFEDGSLEVIPRLAEFHCDQNLGIKYNPNRGDIKDNKFPVAIFS
jgi:hypothetical protein